MRKPVKSNDGKIFAKLIEETREYCRAGKVQSDDPGTPLSKWNDGLVLDSHRQLFDAGHRRLLLDAIAYCAERKIPMPDWAATEYIEAMRKIQTFEVGTWDEAFGPAISPRRQISALRKRRKLSNEVWRSVRTLNERGEAIDAELFAKVGKPLGISGSLARDFYYEIDRITREHPPDL